MARSPDLRGMVRLVLLLAAAAALGEPTTPPALAGLPVTTLEEKPARLEQYASSTPRMSAAQIDTHRAFIENFLRLNFRSLSTAGLQEMLHSAEDAMRVGGTVDIPPPR